MAKLKISVLHKLFSFFVALGVAVGVAAPFAIHVKADSLNYVVVPLSEVVLLSNPTCKWQQSSGNDEVRAVAIKYTDPLSGSVSKRIWYVSLSSSQAVFNMGGNRYGTQNLTSTVTVDSVVYYCAYWGNGTYYDAWVSYYGIENEGEQTLENAVYYTFGDGGGTPEPEVELLGLKNLRYNTRLVGHGTQGYQNIDEITWDPGRDLGENFLVGGTVQIRAVSGKYAALTYDGLKALSIGDFEIFGNPVVLADDIVATVGSFSVTWQTVFNSLTILSANLKAYQDAAGYWNREGWAYQYRYKLDNSTTTTDYSEWFTVYSFTSASGDSTVGLDNNLVAQPGSDGLYNNVVDSFNDINTINADIANNYNTNNYYYIDNNQYLINPDTTQQNTDQQSTWDQFTYKFHEYHDSEDLLINDMNNAIEDLTPSADLNSNNNFLNAANWVKVQFDRMTLNTPMELIIIFSLTLGFGLLLIGRFK